MDRFRILRVLGAIVFTLLAIVVGNSLAEVRVVCERARITSRRGRQVMIVSDGGTGLTSHGVLRWYRERGIECHQMVMGTTLQNMFLKSFNGRLRDERLNEHLFTSQSKARRLI